VSSERIAQQLSAMVTGDLDLEHLLHTRTDTHTDTDMHASLSTAVHSQRVFRRQINCLRAAEFCARGTDSAAA